MTTWEELAYEVFRAQGMVSAQADCTLDEALEMMRERAQIHHQHVSDIANAVLTRRIRFGL
jgi:AmiR/NasT family two-component response regulator